MTGGQNGWPPGGGGPNPWGSAPGAQPGFPQQQGAWGQPPAAPWPPMQGAPVSPGGAEEVLEVELPWPINTVPNACACCGGAPETQLNTQSTAQMGRTTQTRTVSVPYCRRCEAHVKEGGRRGLSLGFIATFAALPFPALVLIAWDYAPWFVAIPAGLAVALTALVVMEQVWKAKPVAREQGCCAGDRPAFWMQGFAFNGPSVRFRGVNPRWVQQLGASYGAQPRPVGPRGAAKARWVAAPLVALLAGIPLWFAMHGHVYLDNPSATPLTFDIDDGNETVTLAPGEHADLWLPSGTAVIAVKNGGQTLETLRGEVGHWSKHAVTPLGISCYGVLVANYGTAAGGSGYSAPATQRWHDLQGVQHVFEPFPRSVSVGRGQRGATRRRFARVVCPY